MICYNCPNWQPRNPYTVNGICTVCGCPTHAAAECFDPAPVESEASTDETL